MEPVCITPYAECNASDQIPALLAGLAIWAQSFREIIVVTGRSDALVEEVFADCVAAYPQLVIIPGVKSTPTVGGVPTAPHDLDDLASWQQVGRLLRRAMAITGATYGFVENEGGWADYTAGTEEIDPEDMAICLAEVPEDTVWYPAIVETDAEPYARQKAFLDLVVAVVAGVELVTFTLADRSCATSPSALEPADSTNRQYGVPCQPILYFDAREIAWDDNQVIAVATLAAATGAAGAILDPGGERWLDCAAAITLLYRQPERAVPIPDVPGGGAFDQLCAGLMAPALRTQFAVAAVYSAPDGTATPCRVIVNEHEFAGAVILDGGAHNDRQSAELLFDPAVVTPAKDGRVVILGSGRSNAWVLSEPPRREGGFWLCPAEFETAARLNPSRKRHGN